MRSLVLFIAVTVAGCGGGPIAQESLPGGVAAEDADVRDLTPSARAVRIGESGAAFPACAMRGVVANAGSTGTALRNAPFDNATADDVRLVEGTPLFVCTRSIDQRWVGVVVPPADAPADGCAVAQPVEGQQDYAGPCRSGWVSFAHVRARTG